MKWSGAWGFFPSKGSICTFWGMFWFKNMNLVKVLQGSLIIMQHLFEVFMSPQRECIVWFKNINLVKIFDGFLIIIQHCFNLFKNPQSGCIVSVKKMNLVNIFQGYSLIIMQHIFDIFHEFSKWMHCLVQEYEPCQGPWKLFHNCSTPIWHINKNP